MRVRFPRFGLPMLAKDLAEMAHRRRTYSVRVAFASLIFSMEALLFLPTYRMTRGRPGGLLGQGATLLDIVYVIETVGLWLFVPAIVSGALTAEKERNTLELLFVTKLGPWTILIEKLVSRLVPIGTFLLISAPLLLVGYSLGGLTPADLEFAAVGLVITALEVACFSLYCSAYCPTSAAAFVASYVTMTGVFFAPYLIVAALALIDTEYGRLCGHRAAFFTRFDPPQWQAAISMAVASTQGLSAELLFRGRTAPGPLRPFHRHPFPLCVMLLCGFCFLLLARFAMVSRATPQPAYRLRGLFRRLDAIWDRINDRVARGIRIGRSGPISRRRIRSRGANAGGGIWGSSITLCGYCSSSNFRFCFTRSSTCGRAATIRRRGIFSRGLSSSREICYGRSPCWLFSCGRRD
jgi:ABC-type transport system involved in multi-copper enzyme maturation permease subunit